MTSNSDLMGKIDKVLVERKLKTTSSKILNSCDLFTKNFVYAADLENYETIKQEIQTKLMYSVLAKFRKQPLQKFLITRLEYPQLQKKSLYSTYAIQILTHELTMEEIKFLNLTQILRLLIN
jgi:hypothetical protein